MTAARVLTINVRRSTYRVGPQWDVRKTHLLKTLQGIDGGPPGVILTQECTKPQMVWLSEQLAYDAYGNGLMQGHPVSGDRDVSSDNVAVLWNPDDWDLLSRWHGWVNTAHKRYIRAVKLQRKGTSRWAWFATTHLSLVSTTMRMHEARSAARIMAQDGLDLTRMVFAGDFNETHMYPARGVRTLLRKEYGFKDQRTVLPDELVHGDSFATHHGWKPTRKTGRWLDDVLLGSKIKPRYCRVIETNTPIPSQGGTDHHGVLAGIEI